MVGAIGKASKDAGITERKIEGLEAQVGKDIRGLVVEAHYCRSMLENGHHTGKGLYEDKKPLGESGLCSRCAVRSLITKTVVLLEVLETQKKHISILD